MSSSSLLLLISVITLVILLYPQWKRRRILARPFPEAWRAIVLDRIPFFHRLEASEQQQLLDLIRLFIADKHFHGCGGMVIDDEIRVTIAAEACLLLLNRKTGIYPRLKHILVYPYAFSALHEEYNVDGTVSLLPRGLLGESWHNGKIILSWDDVMHGVANFQDGHNVVLHEFSHQLDSENGYPNGAPEMRVNSIQIWAQVFSKEFAALTEAARQQQQTVMDHYGATDAAEFFAVATETFFEKPAQMFEKHPALYAQLSKYYRVDPRNWHQNPVLIDELQ